MGWRVTLLAVVLALAGGVWGGSAWREGRTAIAQNKALEKEREADRKTINDLKQVGQELRQRAVDGAVAYQQASERMGAIATQLENYREANRQFAAQQRASLAALAAARPDLRDMRLGDDFLQHWNRSIEGGGAEGQRAPAAAPARPAGKPADAMPRPAAGNKQRPAGAAGQPGRVDHAIPGLPQRQGVAGGGDGRVAGHRMALVLPGGEGLRLAGHGLSG